MATFRYEGPVVIFDRVVQEKFVAETWASSLAKAKSNIAYQWKKKYGRTAGSNITLPGKFKEV